MSSSFFTGCHPQRTKNEWKSTIGLSRSYSPLWRKCYYAFVSRTNMHMLEFVSLAISALTLWSGLMFFLNDQQQRMSRVWTQVFSIALAIVNVVTILWMVYKYVEAVAREVHTKSTISVWVDHAFQGEDDSSRNESKLHKRWRLGSKKKSRTAPKREVRSGGAPKRKVRSGGANFMRWQTMNRRKVSAMVEQKKIMDVHTESVMRRRQSLEVHHERAQVRLRQRLEKRLGNKSRRTRLEKRLRGKSRRRNYKMKAYRNVAAVKARVPAAA